MDEIYRYISFESFVDMVVRQKLTFVHPSLWDDPYELRYLHQEIESKFEKATGELDTDVLGAIMEYIIANKLYAQSWTSLTESDALWRIYSHNNTSVRIAAKTEKIKLLGDVEIIEVDYVDSYEEVVSKKKDFYGLIGTKRKAFSHEHEVRLVKHYKYSGVDDMQEHLKAFLILHGHRDSFLKSIEIDKISEEVAKLVKKTNENLQDKIQVLDFSEIDGFIESVMLNPFAPEWFNETLKTFCEKNNLLYLGKSTLYDGA